MRSSGTGSCIRSLWSFLGKAGDLAQTLDQDVSAVLMGEGVEGLAETLIRHGADHVYLVEDPDLAQYRAVTYATAFEQLIGRHKPNILLMGATHIGRDLAPRVSRRVSVGLTADCTELTIDPDEKILLQTRPAFGGNVMATIANRFSRPQMATVRPGVMEKNEQIDKQGDIIRESVSFTERDLKTKVLEVVREAKKNGDLSKAKIIVAGGRGVGDADGFKILENLADVLGGQVAGTRVAVEEGWIPSDRQVGQTGQSVRPELYIACGISGAIQHRAGIVNARYIVAINRDERAPIFQVADWGIVGDLRDLVPEMIRQLENA